MKNNKSYALLEIIIFFIFICLGWQIIQFRGQTVFASDSPLKDSKVNQIFGPFQKIFDQLQKTQLQETIKSRIKTLLHQDAQKISTQIQKETKKEIVKQTSFLEKGFYKSFDEIKSNIKKLIKNIKIENIKQYFQNIFEEIKWKIFPAPGY